MNALRRKIIEVKEKNEVPRLLVRFDIYHALDFYLML